MSIGLLRVANGIDIPVVDIEDFTEEELEACRRQTLKQILKEMTYALDGGQSS